VAQASRLCGNDKHTFLFNVMRKQERHDEILVKNAILKYTGLPSAVRGNDPPDYWIGEGANRIALEVTIAPSLGGRTTAESTMTRLCNKLNNELGNRIQSAYSMLINIPIPVSNLRQFKVKLRNIIIKLIEENIIYEQWNSFDINGEFIKIKFIIQRRNRIVGIISGKDLPLVPLNRQFDKMINDILNNKYKKCSKFQEEKWLGILNDTVLADDEDIRIATNNCNYNHGFSKIFLIEREGTVNLIYPSS
jgi:hypothetical protein